MIETIISTYVIVMCLWFVVFGGMAVRDAMYARSYMRNESVVVRILVVIAFLGLGVIWPVIFIWFITTADMENI